MVCSCILVLYCCAHINRNQIKYLSCCVGRQELEKVVAMPSNSRLGKDQT